MLRFGSSGSEAPFLTEKDLHEKEKMLEQQVLQFTLASFPKPPAFCFVDEVEEGWKMGKVGEDLSHERRQVNLRWTWGGRGLATDQLQLCMH